MPPPRRDPLDALLAANEAFYDAFNARDADAMDEMLAREHPVACIHPGWQPLVGRDAVLSAWRGVLANPATPQLICERPVALLLGDTGLVICLERLGDAVLAASNMFVLERGLWRLAHHQAGPAAPEDEPAAVPPPRRLH